MPRGRQPRFVDDKNLGLPAPWYDFRLASTIMHDDVPKLPQRVPGIVAGIQGLSVEYNDVHDFTTRRLLMFVGWEPQWADADTPAHQRPILHALGLPVIRIPTYSRSRVEINGLPTAGTERSLEADWEGWPDRSGDSAEAIGTPDFARPV